MGKWQATLLLLNRQDTANILLDSVGLQFNPDGTYAYSATLGYRETGTYKALGNRLWTTPSNQDTLSDRAVAIEKLSADSLDLLMVTQDSDRLLKFVRVQQ